MMRYLFLVLALTLSGCTNKFLDPLKSFVAPENEVTKNSRIVQSGETLQDIASDEGYSLHELASINNITPPYIVRPGDRIFLKGKTHKMLGLKSNDNKKKIVALNKSDAYQVKADKAQVISRTNNEYFGDSKKTGGFKFLKRKSAGVSPELFNKFKSTSKDFGSVAYEDTSSLNIENKNISENKNEITKEDEQIKIVALKTEEIIENQESTNSTKETKLENKKLDELKIDKKTAYFAKISKDAVRLGSSVDSIQKNERKNQNTNIQNKDQATLALKNNKLVWDWPVRGLIVQKFVKSDKTKNGINIKGSIGQQVRAAQNGEVVYSGNGLRGYGNLLIIKHDNDFLSAYAYNKKLLVKEGAKVKKGEVIAKMGSKVNNGDGLLHFEIRHKGKPVDPLSYLK